MKAFLKSKNGKRATIITLLVLIIAAFALYMHNADESLLHHKVDSAVTMNSTKNTLKEDDIRPFTRSDLLRNRKKALQLGVDKYPNGYLIIPSIGIRLPIYNRANNYTLSLGVG